MGLEQTPQTSFANSYRYVLAGLGLVETDATQPQVCAVLDHPEAILDSYKRPGENLTFDKRANCLRADFAAYRSLLPEPINQALREAWGCFGPKDIDILRPVFTALLLYFSKNDFTTPTSRISGERSSLWNLSHRDAVRTAGLPRLPGTRPGALTFHELLGRMREEGLARVYGVGDVRLSRDVWLKAPGFQSMFVDDIVELEAICLRLEERGNFAQAVAELFVKEGQVVSVPVVEGLIQSMNYQKVEDRIIPQGLIETYAKLVVRSLNITSGTIRFLIDPQTAEVYFLKVSRK